MTDTDAATVAAQGTPGNRRDRSPSFPYIGLERAVERTRQLLVAARRHEARLGDAGLAWGLGIKSSATLQTVAALLAFGLIDDSGSGDNRKIKVSDLGWRIIEDHRPGVRESSLDEAARKPKLIAEYITPWGNGRPADNICTSELMFDRGFTDEAAARFLRVFDETIRFVRITGNDSIADRVTGGGEITGREPVISPLPPMKVGDYVQWTSGGIDQFKVPRKVVGLFPDGEHAQVFGSNTGIPMTELTVVDAPEAAVMTLAASPQIERNSAGRQGENDYVVLQRGNRLQITADVDLEGIATLKEMLADYESILKRLAEKKSN